MTDPFTHIAPTPEGLARAFDLNASVWAYANEDYELLAATGMNTMLIARRIDETMRTLREGYPADADHVAAMRASLMFERGLADVRLFELGERHRELTAALVAASQSTERWFDREKGDFVEKEFLRGARDAMECYNFQSARMFLRQAANAESLQRLFRSKPIAHAAELCERFTGQYAVLDGAGIALGRDIEIQHRLGVMEGPIRRLTGAFAYQDVGGQLVVHFRKDLHKPGMDSGAKHPSYLLHEGAHLRIGYRPDSYGVDMERYKPIGLASSAIAGSEKRYETRTTKGRERTAYER